ncbi:hypothetical protein [Azospirillum sp. sgz302134]
MSDERLFAPGDPDYPATPALRDRLARMGKLAPPSNASGRAPGDRQGATGAAVPHADNPRSFTPADKALIRKVHGYMSAEQLLSLLNDRLVSDRGTGVQRYTMQQLYAEIADVAGAAPTDGGYDWAGLRKLLAAARASGVLDQVDEQIIEDFAVVFSLNAKQLLTLKDIVLGAKEERP